MALLSVADSAMPLQKWGGQATDPLGLSKPGRMATLDDVQFCVGQRVGHAMGNIGRSHRVVIAPNELRRLPNPA
jgi:hypothetical protein